MFYLEAHRGFNRNALRACVKTSLGCLCSALFFVVSEAQETGAPIDKLSVVQQKWHQEGKLMIGDLTFRNDNQFAVKNVIVSCDLYGDKAKPEDKRGIAIRKVLPPGTTEVAGIEFPVVGTHATGGPCRVISAQAQ